MSRPGATTDDDIGVELGATLLGKYRIEAILGRGGMGIVARATHLHLDEQVAIKFLRRDAAADPESAQRFLREAQAAVKLKSEHVARVIDVGTLDGHIPYMVMEYLQGSDLDQMLEQSGTVSPELSVDFILQACEALGEAHALGIVHRDIKPSNVFVTWRHDGSVLVKVLDFGISKVQAALTEMSLTQTQSVLGTPAYMSPEQMRSARSVDARTDIWSLGTVLYELVQGNRPFEAESFSEMCVKVAVDAPMPFTVELPPGLEDVILRCLAKDPARRYGNVGELAAELVPFSRDPRAAQLLGERIQRSVARQATPRPVVDHGSAPVVVPRPGHHTTERTAPPAAMSAVPAYPPKKTTPWAGGGAVAATAVASAHPSVNAAAGSGQFPRPETPAPGTDPGWNAGESWNVPSTGASHAPLPWRVSASMGTVGRRVWLIAIVAVLTVGVALVVMRGTESGAKSAVVVPEAPEAPDAAVEQIVPAAVVVDAGVTATPPPIVDAAVAAVEVPDAGVKKIKKPRPRSSPPPRDRDDIFGNRK